MKKKILLILLALLLFAAGYGTFNYFLNLAFIKEADKTALKLDQIPEKITSEDFSKYFTGNRGSFVLFDHNKNEYFIYDQVQGQKRVSPLSTFKILNSLISLETAVLKDENMVFKWSGKRHDIDTWSEDHSLSSAFSNSVVWFFQEVAAKVGEEKMQNLLRVIEYGNADISGGLTNFWLDSSLRISPLEQVVFLRKFYFYDLGFSRRNIDIVKKMMIISKDNGTVLSGKSGLAGKHLGWFVGYVEKDNNVYFFATKIEGTNITHSAARELTEGILRDKEIL